MNKHLLTPIAAAMLPIGMSSASIQSTSVYSYLGSRNNKNATYAAPSNIANQYSQHRINENADKLTAASLQQTLMTEHFFIAHLRPSYLELAHVRTGSTLTAHISQCAFCTFTVVHTTLLADKVIVNTHFIEQIGVICGPVM